MSPIKKIVWNLKRHIKILILRISQVFKHRIKINTSSYAITTLIPATYFSFSGKNYFYDGNTPYWFNFNAISLKPLWFTRIKGTIVGRGIVLNEKKEVLLESTIGQREYLDALGNNHLIYFKSLLPATKLAKAICLSNRLEHNYYHWILESIGRLIFLPKDVLSQYPIIVNNRTQKFVTESLVHLMGIPKSNIVFKKEYAQIEVEEILVPSFPITRNDNTSMTNIYHPYIVQKINDQAKRITAKANKRNIIISRSNAIERRMLDKELIKDSFPNLEFEILNLESLSFKDQMVLFANVGIVVAVHGAGLVNLIFSDSPLVIELFPHNRNKRDSFYFYQISQQLGFKHHLIEYNAINKQQDLLITNEHLEKIGAILMTR